MCGLLWGGRYNEGYQTKINYLIEEDVLKRIEIKRCPEGN